MEHQDRQKRVELSDFLRTRRERVKPAEVGIATTTRRRSLGLLREEVAQLADVSVTWYTWLEQGRPVRVSSATLQNIAKALRLTDDERTHLFTLADRPVRSALGESIAFELSRMLNGIGPNPAYITNHCWDIITMNDAARIGLFRYADNIEPIAYNLVYDVLVNPKRRTEIIDWEQQARRIVGSFRGSFARHREDSRFETIIQRCLDESEEFRHWWKEHEIVEQRPGRITLDHPTWGQISYTYASFRATDTGKLRLTVYTPEEDEFRVRLRAAVDKHRVSSKSECAGDESANAGAR